MEWRIILRGAVGEAGRTGGNQPSVVKRRGHFSGKKAGFGDETKQGWTLFCHFGSGKPKKHRL